MWCVCVRVCGVCVCVCVRVCVVCVCTYKVLTSLKKSIESIHRLHTIEQLT